MKSSHAPHFDMEVCPPQQVPGFQLFQSGDNGQFYFCCCDVNGEPFLYSQAYSGKEAANTGMRTVLRNAVKEKQYKKRHEAGHHFFAIVSGNQQMLARSRNYETEKEVGLAIAFLRQVAVAEHPVVQSPQVAQTKPAPALVAAPIANKHAFRIDYYAAEKVGKWKGRIEHLTSGEYLTLEGIQPEVVSAFVLSRMPGKMNPSAVVAGIPENAVLEIVESPWSEIPAPSAQAKTVVSLNLVLPVNPNQELSVVVSVHQIGGPLRIEQTLRPAKALHFNTFPIELPASYFAQGVYRIEAQAIPIDHDEGNVNWTGSCLLQAY